MGWGGVGPHGRGPLGAQRDPWEPLGAQGIPWEGTLGAPSGIFVFVKLPFSRIRRKQKCKNHSHEIRLEKLVWTLLTRYHFAIRRYQHIEKLWQHFCLAISGLVIAQNSYEFL